MASFLPLQLPNTLRNPRLVSASISSNGSVPSSSNQSSPSGKGGPVIIELPLNQIRRPLMRTRSNDPHKVQELMDSIAQIGLQVPVTSLSNTFILISTVILILNNTVLIQLMLKISFLWIGFLTKLKPNPKVRFFYKLNPKPTVSIWVRFFGFGFSVFSVSDWFFRFNVHP